MIIYILKFSTCLALFLVFYKLVLEKENMHVFKRFYLLGTLLLSIGIPLITFTYYVEPSGEIFPQITQNIPLQKSAILLEPDIDYLPIILWSIYGFGVFLFGVNFLRNLYQLNYKIKHNPKQKNNRITNVLLKDLVIPHTFFNYIFLTKRKFETHQIPKEVFWHEETHAIQKHSIDVLFIEILQIVFWFNPLIYFIKHVVKLNHEFLADQAVLKKGVETTTYQETLLAFSSNAMHPQLANAINYSSIKKRFTVMKTQTTKKAIWLRSLILLPLLAIILYGFSERKEIIKEKKYEKITDIEPNLFLVSIEKNENSIRLKCNNGCKWEDISLDTNAKSIYTINNFGFTDGNTLKTDEFAFTIERSENGVNLTGLKGTTWLDLKFYLKNNQRQVINQNGMIISTKGNFKERGNHSNKTLEIRVFKNKIFINSIRTSLEKYKTDLNSITKDWTDKDYKSIVPKLDISECSEDFLEKLDIEFRKTNYFLTAIQGIKISNQQKATKDQIAEYNKLAKKYNNMSKDNMVIKRSDLERIKYLYDLMSVEQLKKAQPFPSFPTPPPPPAPNTPNAPKANFPPPPPLPKNTTPEQINTYKRAYRD
ncbi:MAG: M56 family metallopeptidase, partial [Chlorobi bacterium]|nr:M56 family metallopeptidase [Chlorobiota bacterium]